MIRNTITPRKNWQKIVEAKGLVYHTADGVPYWDESVFYTFSAKEVDVLEAATNELHGMCLEAAQHVIDQGRFSELGIPESVVPLIVKTWNEEPPALYGRFDFSYDGVNPPKMLEYNADTPTSLLEASVIQWEWMEQSFGWFFNPIYDSEVDQFNSIHDKLVAKFKELKDYFHAGPVHFAAMETWEDFMTIQYLRDCAEQAGVKTVSMKMAEVGWDSVDNCFVDLELRRIRNIFKLYPWEWLVHEEYGQHLLETADQMHWMEPAWKMLLSNKGILPILWELFPNHPNLLPTYFNPDSLARYAKKPLLSREGANVTLVTEGQTYRTQGDYGEEGYIYQVLAPLPNFNGNYPVIGSWVIDQESAGIGIRESNGLITDNLSRFVPHIMKG